MRIIISMSTLNKEKLEELKLTLINNKLITSLLRFHEETYLSDPMLNDTINKTAKMAVVFLVLLPNSAFFLYVGLPSRCDSRLFKVSFSCKKNNMS